MRAIALAACAVAATACHSSSSGGPDADLDPSPDARVESACPVGTDLGADVVVTAQGAVRGIVVGQAREFRGIPFALPPLGERRWRPPEPPACFDGTFDARGFGPPCVQQQPGAVVGDEDCLTLNVWMPATPPAAAAPVIVFLPAGDNLVGGAIQPFDGRLLYDGEALAAAGAIAVTINYRLGALGFLPHPAFAAETGGATGNYGLLDQVAALAWVQRNIAAFGGDPGHVVVSGLSAGASDACALIASPRARGLFTGAWLYSGDCDAVMDPALAASTSQRATQLLGCDRAGDDAAVAACLRAASTADLAHLPSDQPDSDYNPAVDGVVLADHPSGVIARGEHGPVPIVFSTAANEYAQLLDEVVAGPFVTPADYDAALLAIFGDRPTANVVKGFYPLAAYPTPREALVAIFTDVIFDCPNRTSLRAARAGQTEPVWRLYFTHRFAAGPHVADGAAHGFDVMFLFHSFGAEVTADERALGDDMRASLLTFAATGTPGPIRGVVAEPYDVTRDNRMTVDLQPAELDHLRDRQCDFWDGP